MFSPSRIPPHIFYPGLVIAILLMSVAAHVVLVIKATSDGGVDVVPNYYEKAAAWDADQARAAAKRDGRVLKALPTTPPAPETPR